MSAGKKETKIGHHSSWKIKHTVSFFHLANSHRIAWEDPIQTRQCQELQALRGSSTKNQEQLGEESYWRI